MSDTARVEGHFGEWLQGRLGPEGPVALVTLRCPALTVTAHRRPADGLRLAGADILSTGQARHLLEALGLPACGEITLSADMPAGGGCGASTAALLAVARAAGGADLPPVPVAAACLAAEGASDPLMLEAPDAVLWAPREGRSLRPLPPPPAFEIVGGFLGPPQRTDPADTHLPDISDLVEPWREAARRRDRGALARLSTRSAERTTALRGPADDPMADLCRRLAALGHVRAHTGSARGLVYAPGDAPADAAARLAEAGLHGVLRFRTGTP